MIEEKTEAMIQVDQLSFSYTKKPWIKDMSFSVAKGEIFGFLGPSGAGKSTLQKMLTGQISNYTGTVSVAGMDCAHPGREFYEAIGVDFEFSTLYEKLTARQNLSYFSALYRKQPMDMDELLSLVGLSDDAGKRVLDFSKGMKSRLNFIKAMLHDPKLLFLDEPTGALDEQTGRQVLDYICKLQKEYGFTIVMERTI